MKGFSLIELLVGVVVLLLLFALTLPAARQVRQVADIEAARQEVASALAQAKTRTLASEGDETWGVVFSQEEYTLFEGPDFASRDPSADEVFGLPGEAVFSDVGFGGADEVVFDRLTGETSQPGSVTIQLGGKTKTVSVTPEGVVGDVPTPQDEDRVTDSRHVHVDYTGRDIDTADEEVVLEFSSSSFSFPIADNMTGGQVIWEGTPEGETLAIRTHRLNDPSLGTQFSVRRSGELNTTAMAIMLSGDSSGDLVLYDEAGEVTAGSSVYALPPQTQ